MREIISNTQGEIKWRSKSREKSKAAINHCISLITVSVKNLKIMTNRSINLCSLRILTFLKAFQNVFQAIFLIWGTTTKISLILPKISQSMSYIQVFTLTSVELANK